MYETAATGDLVTADEAGSKPEFSCNVCGRRSYSWGSSSAQGINFTSDDASMLAKAFRFGVQFSGQRRCGIGGNNQLLAPVPKCEK